MTNYALLLEEMLVHGPTWHDDLEPIGIETSVQRLTSMTDVRHLIRSQTSVKRRAFDKGACARGGMIYPARRIDHGN